MRRSGVVDEFDLVDGRVYYPLDPALCTAVPTVADALNGADQTAAAASVLPPGAEVFGAVAALPADRLSDAGLVDALVACDRLRAAVDAKQVELLAALAGRDPDGEEYLADEVGCALRLAPSTARSRLDQAGQLTTRLWDTLELMRDGRLSAVHARHLADACGALDDTVVAKVQRRLLPRAPEQTPGEFRAAVRRAIASYDRKNQEERHRDAVAQRHVDKRPDTDGMSWINLFTASDGAEIVWTAVNAWAVRTGAEDRRTADQRRADALVEICAAALDLPGVPAAHGIRPAVTVTIAASTLAGADDQPVYVNGEPLPAVIGRRLAGDPTATLHYRIVDAQGRVQDVACDTRPLRSDTYNPTARVARHVVVRDQYCVLPGCRRAASRCELDHREPWPAGDTSAGNLQPLCKRHHDMKHRSRWRVHRCPDGSYEWASPTRHTYRYRPPELPVPEPSTVAEIIDDPPPF